MKRRIAAAERQIPEANGNEHRRRLQYAVTLDRLGTSRKASRFCQTVSAIALALGDAEPPAPATAYGWVLAFRKCGRDPQSFERYLKLHRPRKPRFDLSETSSRGSL